MKIIFKIKKKEYLKERNSFKMETKFENCINGTLCTIKHKNLEVCGFAQLRPEDKNSKITGETIAYHKANRLLVKEKIKEQKEKIKYLKFLYIYLFPDKFHGKQIEWIKTRFDKLIDKELKILSKLEEEYIEWDNSLSGYIEKRKNSLKVINNFRERKKKENVEK